MGEVAVSLVSLALSPFEQTAHAPGPPEGIWTYGDVLEHLPTEVEIRLALEYRAKEYEKQMRVLPDSLPLPVFPAKPDWKNIGWEAFDGANLLNCILSRINPFYLDQYANSSYRNPSQILTESPHNLKLVRETELDRLAHEISEKVQPKKPSIDWKLIGRVTLIVGGIAILTCVNAMSGGSLTPLQMALIAGATGAVVDGGGEIISNLSDGEPVNWGAVAARTAGGGAKGAIFSIPGLGFAKTTASVMGVAAAENYAYNRANGVDPQEALGNAVANGVVEGTVAGLIDQGAKKLVGMCAKPKPEPKLSHPSPKPLPEPELQPLSEAELEKVVGGAKDPNWRPGGAASAGGTKIPNLEANVEIPGRVQSRINIANGQTRFTPLRSSHEPVSAGFEHVVKGHFDRPLANSRSIFSISKDELKAILQSKEVVSSPVRALPGGQYLRTVDTGKIVGNTALKFGGGETSWINVFTDEAGNLITTYPVSAPK